MGFILIAHPNRFMKMLNIVLQYTALTVIRNPQSSALSNIAIKSITLALNLLKSLFNVFDQILGVFHTNG